MILGIYSSRPGSQSRVEPIRPPKSATSFLGIRAERLLQQSDLTYIGGFKTPFGATIADSYAYGGTALAYWPAHDTILLVGHDQYQKVAEVTIPKNLASSLNLNDYPRATFRQFFADPFDGRVSPIGDSGYKVGGFLVWGDSLISTAYVYYDANGSQTLSHFKSSQDLTRTNDTQGPYQVGTAGAGFVSGPMIPIPTEWQAALGGPALTGHCCMPIISRTSLGPAVSVFDPADVGTRSPVPATQVLSYPLSHPTLGACESSGALFNCSSGSGGFVFPDGTRSVLFFGRLGTGPYCYGVGGATGECRDPTDNNKGPHTYPYQYEVWAYDVLDLISVKNGQKQPWQILPYKTWSFDLPIQNGNRGIAGAAYDPAARRIYISATGVDGDGPLIQVFTVAAP